MSLIDICSDFPPELYQGERKRGNDSEVTLHEKLYFSII